MPDIFEPEEKMKNLVSIICTGVLLTALHAPALAKSGVISTTKSGVISTTKTGTISTTITETTSGNRFGTISTTRSGVVSATRTESSIRLEQSWLMELFFAFVGLW
jgi:hypothetical protein